MLRLQSDIFGPEAKKVEKHWSNMYPAETTIDGIAHPTAEHAYQYAKATFAGDHAQAQKISDTTNPYTAKQLGNRYMFLPGMHIKKRF